MATRHRMLFLLTVMTVLGGCAHSVPRVPPDYTDWVLIHYSTPPEPVLPREEGAADRLVDAIKSPVLGPSDPRPTTVPVAIPAGVRTAEGGIYIDVWIVGRDAGDLGRAMSGGLNLGVIQPWELFRVRVGGVEVGLAPPEIRTRDFVKGFWPAPPHISDRSLAPEPYDPCRYDPCTRTLQPFMVRCGPITAGMCEVTVLGPIQTRAMDRPVQGSTAVVPVRAAR